MTTPKAITDILDWQHRHQGDVAYSETAPSRLWYATENLTKPTDCSGMAIRMYKHFGDDAMRARLKNATYTGNLCTIGSHITSSHSVAAAGKGMHPGDLIFFTWGGHNPTFDHVAIYAGDGRIWNHGGPGYGPVNWSLASNVWAASEVKVMRLLFPAPPAHKPGEKYLRHRWPSWMPKGHVIGNIDASDMYHGGINERERDAVRLAQARLNAVMGADLKVDGTWGLACNRVCHAWHVKHAPRSAHMYSLTHYAWDNLFTY